MIIIITMTQHLEIIHGARQKECSTCIISGKYVSPASQKSLQNILARLTSPAFTDSADAYVHVHVCVCMCVYVCICVCVCISR